MCNTVNLASTDIPTSLCIQKYVIERISIGIPIMTCTKSRLIVDRTENTAKIAGTDSLDSSKSVQVSIFGIIKSHFRYFRFTC
jgi:hypothetical protein